MSQLAYTPLEEIPKVSTEVLEAGPLLTGLVQIHAQLRAGFKAGKLKSIAYRKYQLLQLAYLIKDNKKRLEEALNADLGRPALEGHFLEINSSASEVREAYCNVEKWVKPEKPGFSLNFTVMRPVIYKEAKGVVLIISPFNYPLWLTITPLAAAIAAGNATALKPSESTPAVSSLLAELIPKYLDSDILLELQWDHRKSPVIIDPQCDLEMAARRILWGKCVNAGQTCVAPDYVLVPRSFQDKFVDALKAAYESFYPESAQPSKPDTFSRIITPQAWKRIKGLLDNTKGTVVFGSETDEATKFIAPTAVKDVEADDSLMSEEIFGPVLPIVPVEDVDEAIAFVNAR
ncbi:hypothetical protein C0995_009352 [Termitomyces sp. Mi166|nr:hypothetical protein C0995_009352 [Termitomyces sp. Mi166\